MRKLINIEKELYRGTIKQLMKVNGFRTISISNYNNWKGTVINPVSPVSSLKYNLQDGYLNLFDSHNNKIDDDTAASVYKDVYDVVMEIFKNENKIPHKIKRNILIKINR